MAIELLWEIPVPVDMEGLEPLLARVAEACFKTEGISGAGFCIRILDDAQIHAVNLAQRGVDSVTDVLSFPTVSYPEGRTARSCPKRLRREYDPGLGCNNLGDCLIDLNRAREQALEYGHSLKRELSYLTAHSAFHLMGYDHLNEKEKAVMREMEERALRSVGITREGDVPAYDRLFELACEAMKNSYSPYSHFRVGACILTEDGRTFTGCNFENASYGATICAERCAASCAIAAGARRFAAIAIAADAVAWPCGICRQVLREFSEPSLPVIVGKAGNPYEVMTLGELLPGGFTAGDMDITIE